LVRKIEQTRYNLRYLSENGPASQKLKLDRDMSQIWRNV
jgi:hypothetical protein